MKRLLPLLPMLLAAAEPPAGNPTQWRVVVTSDGELAGRIGETRSADGRETVTEQRFTIQERGDAATTILQRTVTRRDAAGRVTEIVDERRTGRSVATTEAHIASGRADIVQRSPAGPPRRTMIALPPDIRFDSGIGLLAGWDRAATPELGFSALNLDAMAVERVVLAAAATPEGAPPGARALVRRSYDGDSLRGVQLLVLDADGRVTETHQPIFGTVMTIRAATPAEAVAPLAPYRPLQRALVSSPFRIPSRALAGHIRYRFTYRDGIAFPLPATAEQSVTPAADGATLDICGDCGPGLAATPEALDAARRPTAWLQSDSRIIRVLADPARHSGVSGERKMLALVRVAQQQLTTIDFAGHFSAAEAAMRRRGDCTESAALLAALGRAVGIPTKVASGLVYSRAAYHGTANVFLPHSWVLAYVGGRWRSFDAALDGFDATHIALAVGDGDARSIAAANQLAGLIVWREMQEVRRRPAP